MVGGGTRSGSPDLADLQAGTGSWSQPHAFLCGAFKTAFWALKQRSEVGLLNAFPRHASTKIGVSMDRECTQFLEGRKNNEWLGNARGRAQVRAGWHAAIRSKVWQQAKPAASGALGGCLIAIIHLPFAACHAPCGTRATVPGGLVWIQLVGIPAIQKLPPLAASQGRMCGEKPRPRRRRDSRSTC
jgi:hypothetical protein